MERRYTILECSKMSEIICRLEALEKSVAVLKKEHVSLIAEIAVLKKENESIRQEIGSIPVAIVAQQWYLVDLDKNDKLEYVVSYGKNGNINEKI